jgi:hypothetical protein
MTPYIRGYTSTLEKLGVASLLKRIPKNLATGKPFFRKAVKKMEMGMAERAFGSGGGRPPLNPKFPPLKKVK